MVNTIFYTMVYPLTLTLLLIISLPLAWYNPISLKWRWVYVLCMLFCIPYGMIVFLAGITADLFHNPVHIINLSLIIIFESSVNVLYLYLLHNGQKLYHNNRLLCMPLIVFLASLLCSFTIVWKY